MRRKPMKRTEMARGTTQMKRTKQLGPGKKTKAKRTAMDNALAGYFERHGWDDATKAACQFCGLTLHRDACDRHHKTPRSEMRKAGIKDLDAAHRLLILHKGCHRRLHRGQMGRPADPDGALTFKLVEDDNSNAENGLIIYRLP